MDFRGCFGADLMSFHQIKTEKRRKSEGRISHRDVIDSALYNII